MSDETEKLPTAGGEFADMLAQWKAAGLIDTNAPKPAPVDTYAYLRAQRLERFKAHCPAEFSQKIDRSRLPNLPAWDAADAWGFCSPGLWLWSHESGRGKSRMAWRLYGRAHVERGLYCVKGSGQSLCEDYFAYHMDGNPRGFYRDLLKVDILIIDDIDKADFTERNKRTIRELFDELYAHRKAVIVTAQEPISFFANVIGDSCVRRMREVCREIPF